MEWQKCGPKWEAKPGMVLLLEDGAVEDLTEALVGDCNAERGMCNCCELMTSQIKGWAWATPEWLAGRKP